MSSIYNWSITSDKNADSDSSINWRVGQPPSSVNGSARAMMQRIAEYLQDLSGGISVSGDANKLEVEITSKINAYTDGIRFFFRACVTNEAEAQLRIKGLAYLPIYQCTEAGLQKILAGSCRKGGLYEVIYSKHLGENNSGGWFINNPTPIAPNQEKIPAGTVISYCKESYDGKDWLICDGAELEKSKYPDLYTAIGDVWGKAKANGNFCIPDMRGVFLRGYDPVHKFDGAEAFGHFQQSAIKAHSHNASSSIAGEHSHEVLYGRPKSYINNDVHDFYQHYLLKKGNYKFIGTKETSPIKFSGNHRHKVTVEESGSDDVRPYNVAVNYIIKVRE